MSGEKREFHLGQIVHDVLGREVLVVGCTGQLVVYRRVENPFRYDDGHPMVEESFVSVMSHLDGTPLGQYSPISDDLWWVSFPDPLDEDESEAEFGRRHRQAMNEAVRRATHP